MTCPACGRPVALARPACLYCGAPLSAAALASQAPAAAALAPAADAGRPERRVLALDAGSGPPARLQEALGVTAYEAGQLARRGGWQLWRIADPEQAEAETRRLGEAGLRALAVPEAEARQALQPVLVEGGSWSDPGLALRTPQGALRLLADELLLVVRGPITRVHQTELEGSRVRTATLAEGLRLHLYRGGEPRPLELDPAAFDFGSEPPESGSALLTIGAWIDELARRVALDDGFRRVPPALAPSTQASGLAGLARSAPPGAPGTRRADGGPVVLDNLAQFRFHSGWRAAVERRLR